MDTEFKLLIEEIERAVISLEIELARIDKEQRLLLSEIEQFKHNSRQAKKLEASEKLEALRLLGEVDRKEMLLNGV